MDDSPNAEKLREALNGAEPWEILQVLAEELPTKVEGFTDVKTPYGDPSEDARLIAIAHLAKK
ncbi:hypothetical protein I4940_07995 [Pseudomonas aeruginosa]|nr:hypothetical protein [Pseudomonas aeruginosa]MBG7570819.1 hypothetical protein [Pseudomonas aeruginosa]